MDRTRHKIGNYLNDRKTHKMTNEPLFKRLNTLESTREVELLKSKIEHRESIVLGFYTAVCKTEKIRALL